MNQKEHKAGLAFILILSAFIVILYLKIFVSFENQQSKGSNRVFGATYMTMNNEFYTAVNNEIQAEVDKNDDKLITLDPALNAEKQREQIYYLINEKVDCIFVTPVDWKKLDAPLKAAKKAGIPVIAVDAPVYHEKLVSTTIVSDNYNAGKLCAINMMKKMSHADILLLTHHNAKSAIDRITGFLDAIKGNDNYRVVGEADTEGQTERTLPKVKQFIKKGITIDVVMALNDPTAIGALAAFDEAGKSRDVIVYGVDGSPDGKSLIKEKMLTATAAQYPKEMGKKAVEAGYKLVKHKKVKSEIIIPIKLIDQSNISKFDIQNWQ
ncbi:MAG: sugar ABC transporter substrate-binding protein [Anaerostipes sp.]|jgi:ribose transport system substrate-binding protein